jgi:hypothetical protein
MRMFRIVKMATMIEGRAIEKQRFFVGFFFVEKMTKCKGYS